MLLKSRRFEFGPFHLDTADQLLSRDGKALALAPKAFETLVYLVENPARLVTREELIGAVWPNSFVEDGSLSVNISLVRRILGEMDDGEPYIETVPRKGYRFRPEVKEVVAWSMATADPGLSPLTATVVEMTDLSSAVAPSKQQADSVTVTLPPRPAWARRYIVLTAALIAVALIFGGALWVMHKLRGTSPPFARMKISRLTWRGRVADAAISPDGKYVAYILNGENGQSLWIRQVEVFGNIRLIGPGDEKYTSLVFSPDGNFLYYTNTDKENLQTLHRMPFLGGDSVRLLSGLTGPISFSPDGTQLAFFRLDPAGGGSSLMLAKADGTGVHMLARRSRPRYFSSLGVAWLPDGHAIACFAGDAAAYGTHAFHLVKVRLAGGAEEPLTAYSWSWSGPIASASDGQSLLLSASEEADDALQIWRVSLRDGEVSRVTNDLSNYAHLSSTVSGKTLAAVQGDRSAELWLTRGKDLSSAAPISSGDVRGLNDVTWTANGLIAYSARLGDKFSIFTVNSEGELFKQLTLEAGDKKESAFTPDGRYVLYQSADGKIWRLNRDGTAPRQLTFGAHDVHPTPCPDSQCVFYASFVKWSPSIGGKPTLWSVPIDGGKAKQLTSAASSFPQFSPDGKLIAASYYRGDDPRFSRNEIAIFGREGGTPLKIFERAPALDGDQVYWAPDGKNLDYAVRNAGVGNIWRQSLEGGAPFQLTHFSSDELFDFAWSANGKRLVMARGKSLSDVVLIKDAE